MENTLHYIPHSYPKYQKNQAYVIAHTKSGNRIKAMFYWNGNRPTFASYGTDISDRVIAWEYNTEIYNKYNKEIPQ